MTGPRHVDTPLTMLHQRFSPGPWAVHPSPLGVVASQARCCGRAAPGCTATLQKANEAEHATFRHDARNSMLVGAAFGDGKQGVCNEGLSAGSRVHEEQSFCMRDCFFHGDCLGQIW